MATIKYSGNTAMGRMATKIQTLVNAVQETVSNVNAIAQAASAEAKYYGTCATAAGTVAKVVTCANFKLIAGVRIAIKMTNACTSATATINVNGTGAKALNWVGTTTTTNAWDANETVVLVYDGSVYHLIKSTKLTLASIGGTLSIAKGGTGATTAAQALTNLGAAAANHTHTLASLGAAASSHKHSADDITSGTLPITRGGTGQTTAAGILSAIGAAPAAHNHSADNITSGTLPLARGGTGGTTAAEALAAIGAAASNHTHTPASIGAAPSAHNHDASNITAGTLPIARGGTGQTTAAGILSAIGAAAASHNHSATNITSGTLPIARGGTGATSAAAACTALGAARRALYNVSVPTGSWSAVSSGGYSKAISVSGILASDVPVVGIVLSSDTASAKLQGAAFACVNRIVTSANAITLYAFNTAPTTAMSLQLLVLR